MDRQLKLITLYEFICKQYREQLWVYCQRRGRRCFLKSGCSTLVNWLEAAIRSLGRSQWIGR